MEYKEAIRMVFDNKGEGVFQEAFLLRSLLSDIVKSSFADYKLVCLLHKLYEYTNVYDLFKSKGLDKAREEIVLFYPHFEKEYSKREFVDAVNPIASICCPNEYKENNRPRISNPAKIIKIKATHTPQIVISPRPNPVNKANKPRKTTFKSVDIRTNATSLEIIKSNTKTPKVYVDKQEIKLDLASLIAGGNTLPLHFSSKGSLIEVCLPDKKYQSITIVGGDTRINICDLSFDGINAKTLKIANKTKIISCNATCNDLTLLSEEGELFFCGNAKKLDFKTKQGGVNFFMNSQVSNVELKASSGRSIEGRFSGKIFRLHKHFLHGARIIKDYQKKGNHIHLDLSAWRYISIK